MCEFNQLANVAIYQSVLWPYKKVTMKSGQCRQVCLVFANLVLQKCEADFLFIIVNIWSSVLSLDFSVYAIIKNTL